MLKINQNSIKNDYNFFNFKMIVLLYITKKTLVTRLLITNTFLIAENNVAYNWKFEI